VTGSAAAKSPIEVETAVCELRREHPRWGPRRLAHELGRVGMAPVPSRMTVYRILVRHGLVEVRKRGRRREDYRRWERDAPMALWQLDIVGGVFLADGTEVKVVTGVDDHSLLSVIASACLRATGRAVCLAFARALGRYRVPEETDNGKLHSTCQAADCCASLTVGASVSGAGSGAGEPVGEVGVEAGEVGSGGPVGDVAVGAHEVLSGDIALAETQSLVGLALGVVECA
jgi:transposase InsO family protein